MDLHMLLLIVITLSQVFLQVSKARTLATEAEVLAGNSKTVAMNSNPIEVQNATTVPGQNPLRSNETAVATESTAPNSPLTVVAHILRTKRETEATLPYDFDTLHLPCDFDNIGKRNLLLYNYPNHCKWTFNNRFVHEGFFRVFKTYQLEAFFFGQWYERLKRFEMDPHVWEAV